MNIKTKRRPPLSNIRRIQTILGRKPEFGQALEDKMEIEKRGGEKKPGFPVRPQGGRGTESRRSRSSEGCKKKGLGSRPVWVRPPQPGKFEYFSGLSRGKMYQAEALGYVRSVSLKPPGAERGVKLFNLQSLLDYIDSVANQSTSGTEEHGQATPTRNREIGSKNK